MCMLGKRLEKREGLWFKGMERTEFRETSEQEGPPTLVTLGVCFFPWVRAGIGLVIVSRYMRRLADCIRPPCQAIGDGTTSGTVAQ